MTPSRDSTDPTPDPRIEAVMRVLRAARNRDAFLGGEVPTPDGELARAILDALGPMVPLARAQELERERESFGRLASAWQARHDEMERLAAGESRERAERAEEAARDFARALREVATRCYCQRSGQSCEACRPAYLALASHPGFLPDTAQDSSPKRD